MSAPSHNSTRLASHAGAKFSNLEQWVPSALIAFSMNQRHATLGLVISVEIVDGIDDRTGTFKHEYVNVVVFDHYDNSIKKVTYANASAWEPIA